VNTTKHVIKTALLLLGLASQPVFAKPHGHFVFEAGGFSAREGKAQDIGIIDLIGNRFTLDHHDSQNFILGLGYFFDGVHRRRFNLTYGINAFYLAQTFVEGNVIQEQLFTNLSYRYALTHFPIYAAAKALINTSRDCALTFDLGIGPNIIHTSHFNERPLPDSDAIPDHAFSGRTSAAFSATAGIGIKFNNALGRLPFEVGYRFFYLGQSRLEKTNNQLTSTLKTGNNYANALIFSVSM